MNNLQFVIIEGNMIKSFTHVLTDKKWILTPENGVIKLTEDSKKGREFPIKNMNTVKKLRKSLNRNEDIVTLFISKLDDHFILR